MKIEQLLFENFNELKQEFDEIFSDNASMNMRHTVMRKYMEVMENDYAVKLFGRNHHPVDVYQQLRKMNVQFHPSINDASQVLGQWRRSRDVQMYGFNSREVISWLMSVIEKVQEVTEKKKFKEEKGEYKVVHKASNFIVFQVFSKAASCSLGSNTKWCISARGSENYYDQYAQRNDIYIVHTNRDKYAFIVNKNTREIEEYQRGDNDFSDMNPHAEEILLHNLKRDGVDTNELTDAMNTESLEKLTYPKYEGHRVYTDGPEPPMVIVQVGAENQRKSAKVVIDLVPSNDPMYQFETEFYDDSITSSIESAFKEVGVFINIEITVDFISKLESALARDGIKLEILNI